MAGVLPGKLIQMKIGGTYINCQMDLTLAINNNITDDDACKPDEESAGLSGTWTTHTVDSRGWTASVSAKTFADVIAGKLTNIDVSNLIINGNSSVELIIQTVTTTDYDYGQVFLYEGTATITSYTLNAPASGDSTWDLELTGNGALEFEATPYTT